MQPRLTTPSQPWEWTGILTFFPSSCVEAEAVRSRSTESVCRAEQAVAMAVCQETSGGWEGGGAVASPGPSENMGVWFMDWFNLQATCLSLERFAASIQVSRERKSTGGTFSCITPPWFPPPPHLILLGFRSSSGKFTLLFVFFLI